MKFKLCVLLLFSSLLSAHYQAEHYVSFDEKMKSQFLQKDSLINQFGVDFFSGVSFQPLLQGLLTGVHPHEILSIDQTQEHSYVLIKSTSNYVYLFGNPNHDQLQSIMKILQPYSVLVLICDEFLQSYFVSQGFFIQPRIECKHSRYHAEELSSVIPKGFSVQKLDLALLQQSPWYGFLVSLQGTVERFLDIGFGFALVDEYGQSVAQAYGAFLGDGLCEIGVVTHPDHRGKGYILYPAQAVIQECYARGLVPVWSCNSENIASLKTALKLGFHIKRHYIFLKRHSI